MSHSDVADELFTLLAAGHETTATSLAWAVERLRRHPEVLSRLVEEVDAGELALLQATIHEVQRNRPVFDGAARQVIAPSMPLGSARRFGHHCRRPDDRCARRRARPTDPGPRTIALTVVKQTQYEGIARAPDRTRIAVQVRGDGSPLLLLPG